MGESGSLGLARRWNSAPGGQEGQSVAETVMKTRSVGAQTGSHPDPKKREHQRRGADEGLGGGTPGGSWPAPPTPPENGFNVGDEDSTAPLGRSHPSFLLTGGGGHLHPGNPEPQGGLLALGPSLGDMVAGCGGSPCTALSELQVEPGSPAHGLRVAQKSDAGSRANMLGKQHAFRVAFAGPKFLHQHVQSPKLPSSSSF